MTDQSERQIIGQQIEQLATDAEMPVALLAGPTSAEAFSAHPLQGRMRTRLERARQAAEQVTEALVSALAEEAGPTL